MDELLIKYLLQEATPTEAAEAEAWLTADSNNEKYFNALRHVWERSKTLLAKTDSNEEKAWQLFQNRIGRAKQVPKIQSRFRWMQVAALVLLVTGLGLLAYLQLKQKPVPMLTVQSFRVVKRDTLPDGSVVTLNKNSTITFPETFKGGTRNVSLQGEAFFNVHPDKKKPFVISVNDVSIKVVGTSFNVRSENGLTEVTVETGAVEVKKGNEVLMLSPDQRTTVSKARTSLVKEQIQDRLYNYYQSRQFVCVNTPLWKLVALLNKAYDTNIIIEKPELRTLLLTTTFSNESLKRILQIISLTFNIAVEESDTAIYLK